MKYLWRHMTANMITKDEVKRYLDDADLHQVMFQNARHHPLHSLIQSYYISLWSQVDLHYAMNYILSDFCTALDEAAIVVLLKQLTVFASSNDIFAGIIQAIWVRLFHHKNIKSAVLDYERKNVASYSLVTLSVYDSYIDTFMRLFNESMNANQQITLDTYKCVARRLGRIPRESFGHQHKEAIETVWSKVIPTLTRLNKRDRQNWVRQMKQICKKFELIELAQAVKVFARS